MAEIDITGLNTCPRDAVDSLFDRTEEIITLLKERLHDIAKIRRERAGSEREIFDKYSSPDTIVIDGRRGTGKTTHLLTIKYKINKDSNLRVKVLNIIDPTNITDKIDILQVFLGAVKEELINFQTRFNLSPEKEEQIDRTIERINDITRNLIKINSEKFLESEDEALETNRKLADLPFTIHELAKNLCNILDVDVILLPIDDVDMNLKQTFRILTFIKDHFSTPYIIPVVALDISQALAVVKKEKYSFFKVELSQKPSEIDLSLKFLDKLPSEWLQKVFPPSRRITLPDIYQIYREYLEKKRGGEVTYFTYSMDGKTLKLEFSQALELIFSVIYEWNNVEKDNPDSYYVLNYLEGRSTRDFLNDLRALMRSILQSYTEGRVLREEGGVTWISLNNEPIKARFKPFALYKESTPIDGIRWFWESFKKVFNVRWQEIEKDVSKGIKNLRDTVREVLKIADEENKIISRLEKTYYRLLLQEIYTERVELGLEVNGNEIRVARKNGYLLVNRVINLERMFRLIFQTLIPAYIFYWGVKKKLIDYDSFDYGEFSDLYASLRRERSDEAVREFLHRTAVWHLYYGYKEKNLPFISIYFHNKKVVERAEKSFCYLKKLCPESPIGKPQDPDDPENSYIHQYHPEAPAVPHVYFSPFEFWIQLIDRVKDRIKKKENYSPQVKVSPPWSVGIELLREIVKHYISNLIDGLYNFNTYWKDKFPSAIENRDSLKSEVSNYLKLEEKILKIQKPIMEVTLENKKPTVQELEKARSKANGLIKELNKLLKETSFPKKLSISPILEPIGEKREEIEKELRKELRRVLRELEEVRKSVEKKLKGAIETLVNPERALVRCMIAALGLPIHHTLITLLRHTGKVEEFKEKSKINLHTGYIRYGFRPLYEAGMDKFPSWDPYDELETLLEWEPFKSGNQVLNSIVSLLKEELYENECFKKAVQNSLEGISHCLGINEKEAKELLEKLKDL